MRYHLDKNNLVTMFYEGENTVRKGDFDKAASIFEEIYKIGTETNNDFAKGLYFLGLSLIAYYTWKHHNMLELSKKAAKFLEKSSEGKSFLIRAQNNEALALLYSGKRESALEIFKINLTMADEINNPIEKVVALNNIGYTLMGNGMYKESLKNLEAALQILEEIKNPYLEIIVKDNIANVYIRQGKYLDAEAIISENLNKAHNIESKLLEASSYKTLGNLYLRWGKYDQALFYLNIALNKALEVNDKRHLPRIYAQLGECYLEMGNIDEALRYFGESIEVYRQTRIEEDIVETYGAYSLLVLYSGHPTQATDLLNEAAIKAYEHRSFQEHLIVHYYLGIHYLYGVQKPGIAHHTLDYVYREALNRDIYDLMLRSCLSLAETWSLEFYHSKNDKYFEVARDYVEQLLLLAEKQQVIPFMIQGYIVKALLHLARAQFEETEEILKNAYDLAERYGHHTRRNMIKKLLQQAQINAMLYEQREDNETSQAQLQEIATLEIIWQLLQLSSGRLVSFPIGTTDILQSKIYVIGQSFMGPKLIVHEDGESDNLPLSQLREVQLMATTFSIAVAQGEQYHEGLYGPFPYPDHPDLLVLVFSKFLPDSKMDDPRFDKENYCLFVFAYPKGFYQIQFNRNEIEQIFKEFTESIIDVRDIRPQHLKELKRTIFRQCFHRLPIG